MKQFFINFMPETLTKLDMIDFGRSIGVDYIDFMMEPIRKFTNIVTLKLPICLKSLENIHQLLFTINPLVKLKYLTLHIYDKGDLCQSAKL